MASGATWQRRLPSLMRFARVVAASQAAGSYEPQMMPAHKAVDLAGRLTRLSAMRKAVAVGGLAKSAPAVPALIFRPAEPITLQKWLGAAANVAAFALPMAAGTARGQRAISWAGRKVMSGGQSVGRAFGGKSPRPRMQDGKRSGMSGFSKFRRNPGRAVMATNRGIYNNRGSILLGTGTAIGGYEADQAWRNATPKQRAQGNVRV